jgi:type IV pilus assembly protein PilO
MDFKVDLDEKLEQLAQVPKAARLGAVAAIVAGVLAGYYFLYYQSTQSDVQRLRAQSNELQRKLNKVRVVATNIGEFEQEVAKLQRELERALKQLPDRKQFEDLLQDITTAGKKVGVTIKSIERQPEVPHDFYAEVPFKLELEGSYHDLAMFFERVARLPRIVNVGALTVEVASESPARTLLRVKGTATTFRFLSEAEAPAAPAPGGRGRA